MVITVTQMCKKAKGVTCTSKHIVDKMWTHWCLKGGKERGKENSDNKEETSLAKADDKTKGKKKKGDKDKKKETHNCNHCQKKGHKGTLKPIAGRNIQQICPNSFGREGCKD